MLVVCFLKLASLRKQGWLAVRPSSPPAKLLIYLANFSFT